MEPGENSVGITLHGVLESPGSQRNIILARNIIYSILCLFALFIAIVHIQGHASINYMSDFHDFTIRRTLRKNTSSDLIFNVTSWVNIEALTGKRMTRQCRQLQNVSVKRLYVASGVTRLIQVCPPDAKRIPHGVEYSNGIKMVKNDQQFFMNLGEVTYNLSGDVLLNSEGGACDGNQDCKDGLFCNIEYTCQKLDEWACLLDRDDRDCKILNDTIRTTCHATEDILGHGRCSCNTDPSKNSCDDDQTCDFPCQVPDALPSCESPRSRNLFCIAFTKNGLSECPAGGEQSQLCTRPPTAPPTRRPSTLRPSRAQN